MASAFYSVCIAGSFGFGNYKNSNQSKYNKKNNNKHRNFLHFYNIETLKQNTTRMSRNGSVTLSTIYANYSRKVFTAQKFILQLI